MARRHILASQDLGEKESSNTIDIEAWDRCCFLSQTDERRDSIQLTVAQAEALIVFLEEWLGHA